MLIIKLNCIRSNFYYYKVNRFCLLYLRLSPTSTGLADTNPFDDAEVALAGAVRFKTLSLGAWLFWLRLRPSYVVKLRSKPLLMDRLVGSLGRARPGPPFPTRLPGKENVFHSCLALV